MKKPTLARLRAHAIARSLSSSRSLAKAVEKLGFVQADPIRAPARAQDLILRHRVRNYRAGDLERRYPTLDVDEGVLYAYGFLARDLWRLVQLPNVKGLSKFEARVLATVKKIGETHPRQLDAEFGRDRVRNAWGGSSVATTRALENLHARGLLRVVRRSKGIRVYEGAPTQTSAVSEQERFRELLCVAAKILAPCEVSVLVGALRPVRRRCGVTAKIARTVVDELVGEGALERAEVDGVTYLWPASRGVSKPVPRVVRFLAPFDPVVWDRNRFEHFWGWPYRFEAYTPKAKRVRGYYALPMLWGERVIGWANVAANKGEMNVDLGYVAEKPRANEFEVELEAEIERMREFLRLPRPG